MVDTDCPLVLIEWEDSVQPIPRWVRLSEFEPSGPVSCVSVGWLIQNDGKVKILAPNMGEIGDAKQIQASGIILIPTSAVTRILHLREGQKLICPSSRPVQERKQKLS